MPSVTDKQRPNIILILADDMGYSDIGCYGSEIRTPNLDRLGAGGLRFTQMYNAARCCPTRASLLTGLNPHQAGIGHMVSDLGVPSYQGYLNDNCVTIAEALRPHGYRTLMSGKWHVGGDYPPLQPQDWRPGEPGHPLPTQRGFDQFFGTLTGAGNYFNPITLTRGESLISVDSPGFYYTDAISDHAAQMVRDTAGAGRPFFLYVSYTAPHWPLHALEGDIGRYEGAYLDGWDALRGGRHEQQKSLGVVDQKWPISRRDPDAPAWQDVRHRDWEALRMAVYAAQIDSMDRGVGRIMAALGDAGAEENTLVMFLADNGGCAEFLKEDTATAEPSRWATPTADGRKVRVGNSPDIRPGPDDTFMSYDLPWANASNTPFRLFKHWVHEGGISTPFIVSWPGRIQTPGIVDGPAYITDIMATCLSAAGVSYPAENGGAPVLPLEGESLMPAIDGAEWTREHPIYWEHEGNRAVRLGQWKLVSKYPGPWELYDIDEDRTEQNDLAGRDRQRVSEMSALYEQWADRCGVEPWPVRPSSRGGSTRGSHDHVVG